MKSQRLVNGYLQVNLQIPGSEKSKLHYSHRIIAKTFVANPNAYNMVDHIDGNCLNNHATNLRWVKDIKENLNNPISIQKKIDHWRILQIDCDTGEALREWPNSYCIQETLGFGSGNIRMCCVGRYKTSNGYVWKFLDS